MAFFFVGSSDFLFVHRGKFREESFVVISAHAFAKPANFLQFCHHPSFSSSSFSGQ